MKTRIVLFVAAALILFSFTVISKSRPQETQAPKNVAESPEKAPQGGFALEDRDQWK